MNIIVAALLSAAAAAPAREEIASKVQAAKALFSHEPTCSETVTWGLKIAKKQRKVKIPSTRAIRASSLLPVLRLSASKSMEYDESFTLLHNDDSTLKIYTDDDLQLRLTLQWDLASIVFNPSEDSIIARRQAEEKQNLELKEFIIQAYHERRKLQILLVLLSGSVPLETEVEWSVRVDELTSLLDALTEGWFSKESTKRKAQKKSLSSASNPPQSLVVIPSKTAFSPKLAGSLLKAAHLE